MAFLVEESSLFAQQRRRNLGAAVRKKDQYIMVSHINHARHSDLLLLCRFHAQTACSGFISSFVGL